MLLYCAKGANKADMTREKQEKWKYSLGLNKISTTKKIHDCQDRKSKECSVPVLCSVHCYTARWLHNSLPTLNNQSLVESSSTTLHCQAPLNCRRGNRLTKFLLEEMSKIGCSHDLLNQMQTLWPVCWAWWSSCWKSLRTLTKLCVYWA